MCAFIYPEKSGPLTLMAPDCRQYSRTTRTAVYGALALS